MGNVFKTSLGRGSAVRRGKRTSPGCPGCLLFRRRSRRRRRLIISAKVNVAIKMQNISPLSLSLRRPPIGRRRDPPNPSSSLLFSSSSFTAKGSFSVSISKEHLALPLVDHPLPPLTDPVIALRDTCSSAHHAQECSYFCSVTSLPPEILQIGRLLSSSHVLVPFAKQCNEP